MYKYWLSFPPTEPEERLEIKTGRPPVVVATFTGPLAKDQAAIEVKRLNDLVLQEALAARLDRFVTNWYCTTDAADVPRLCGIDKTTPEQVSTKFDVQLLHNAGCWSLWVDGFTKPVNDLPTGGCLPPAAVSLITTLTESDSGSVNLPGGLMSLANVVKTERIATRTLRSNGVYAADRVETIRLTKQDGSTHDMFARTQGYFEGYGFDLYSSMEHALDEVHSGPPPVYRYDPQLGLVKADH